MNQINLNRLLCLLCLWLSAPAMALDSDRNKPLKIVADTALIDEKSGMAVYTGSVVLIQGTLKIVADKLSIQTIEGKVDKVMADGAPALFSQVPEPNQSEVIAKAKRIDYMVIDQKLLLKRSASIVQEDNIFRGEEILYEIQSQRLQAQGETKDHKPGDIKRRVEMILPAAAEPTPEKK
ncbi:lipopolysaccharide transport periplasmic protein LptA [Ketobacter sp. MCCC 1A13808]|uniref:lipopolysaccharide transport periplasmic protein LptA n=1 Tax=Ketobacter sp. MCCC 1A13808 TaxID=2602738 RepID=UPI000F0D346F|nr:lipopolysaccharide transport periplasmic protein LptA [Ketobacter sp. MCCC 1A13808]MVF11246.1 lipopolysaccharide transport periplasmic protein LptA [Ketobacter sp. MCCC 1A13808]RLP53623.1 MAG: lipopolysaccharide transport periplasmic protein LptA [Ketobacter sp.]